MKKDYFLIILAGVVIGAIAVYLMLTGNPPNMGLCIACFERDIAGAIGLHRAALVQYLRPEIIGIVFGALIAAFIFKEFKPTSGSSPTIRFFLGMTSMIGALVFLGCPLRMTLRLAGGDLNALVALFGFIVGITVGTLFLKSNFDLGQAKKASYLESFIFPLIILVLLLLLFLKPVFNPKAGGPIFFSTEGPGSKHVFPLIGLAAGLVVGFLAQRTRLCFAGGIRDLILFREFYLLLGFIAIFFTVLGGDLLFGFFRIGFVNQPIAHTVHLWNFLGMSLVGLNAVLLGGCPLRQLVLAAQGSGDSALTVLGYVVGAGVAHNFMLVGFPPPTPPALGPTGVLIYGKVAVIAGIIFSLVVGYFNLVKEK